MSPADIRKASALMACFLLASFLAAQVLLATVPNEISFQGRLTDNSQPEPMPIDDVLPLEFRIFGSLFGADLLWSESWATVQVVNGIFNVMLGSNGTPIPTSLFADHLELYLELEVDGETLAPRQRIGSVGYAHRAATAVSAEELEGLGPESWQRRVVATCPPGSSIRQIDPEGTVQCQPDETGILSESDPQVGVVATGGVPRWDGSTLATGSIFDDGIQVDLGVNEINLGTGSQASAGFTFDQGETVNPEFHWDPVVHRFRLTGSPGTASPAFRHGAMDGLEFRPLDGWFLGRDRTGLWFPVTHPKATYWFSGVTSSDVRGNADVADNVICWAYNTDCGGFPIDLTEHTFKFQLEATFSPTGGSPHICGPTGDEACSQIEWNIDYVPAAGALAHTVWRPLTFHMIEEGNDLDGTVSLKWNSFRRVDSSSHFRVSKEGRVQINSDGTFAKYPFEVFGDSRFIGGDLRIDTDRGLLWKDQGGGASAVETRIRADPYATEDVTLILPGSTGEAGDYLGTDGTGKLSFSVPLSTSSDSHGLVMWSDATNAARDTGDEVCGSVGQQCVMTVDIGAASSYSCGTSHGSGGHTGAAHLFQAFCK